MVVQKYISIGTHNFKIWSLNRYVPTYVYLKIPKIRSRLTELLKKDK